jgi:DNA-binding NarL/FixJ family response regulator
VTAVIATAARPRVLLADDHQIVAEGVARLLAPDYDLLAILSDGNGLVDATLEECPDIVVADIAMPDMSGIEALRQLRQAGSMAPMVFLTMHNEPAMVEEALDAGARGYVLKAAAGEELLQAMREVLAGGAYVSPALWQSVIGRSSLPTLTARQKTVLGLLAEGLRSREIAARLGLSVRTVEAHRHALMQAMSARNSIELVREAARLGLITTS